LEAAIAGPRAVVEHVTSWAEALRIACFCTNAQDLARLQQATLVAGEGN
jgi:isopentenyl-diphosphate delta-isomerase